MYLNLVGREPRGCVAQADYERVREELAAEITEMRDPNSGAPMIEKVLRREEVYDGPYLEEAADLILVPYRGYDLKARLHSESLVSKDALVGMHTFDDAFFYHSDSHVSRDVDTIEDVYPAVMESLV